MVNTSNEINGPLEGPVHVLVEEKATKTNLMEVINIKEVKTRAGRTHYIQLMLSDGNKQVNGILGSKFHSLITESKLVENSIICVKKYLEHIMMGKPTWVLLGIEVHPIPGSRIGSQGPLEVTSKSIPNFDYGSVRALVNNKPSDKYLMQVMKITEVQSQNLKRSRRIHVTLSDGKEFIHTVLASKLYPLIYESKLVENSIIRVKKYSKHTSTTMGKPTVVLIGIEVHSNPGSRIGTKEPVEVTLAVSRRKMLSSTEEIIGLSQGSARRFVHDKASSNDTIQVIYIGEVQSQNGKVVGVFLSDGRECVQCWLASQLIPLVKNSILVENSVIRVKDYQTHSMMGKIIVMLQDIEVQWNHGSRIGAWEPIQIATKHVHSNTHREVIPEVSSCSSDTKNNSEDGVFGTLTKSPRSVIPDALNSFE